MKSLVVVVAALAACVSASPFEILQKRDLPANCTNYVSVPAGVVCIRRPTGCTANYTVEAGETCSSLIDKVPNVSATQLAKWNPEIGRSCFGLRAYVPICINVPGYKFEGHPKAGDLAPSAVEPVPIMPNILAECKVFAYVDNRGQPYWNELLEKNNISADEFLRLNPSSRREADGRIINWAGYYVCVGGQQANRPNPNTPPTVVVVPSRV